MTLSIQPLEDIIDHIQRGERSAARSALSAMMEGVDLRADPRAVQQLIFGGALAKRLSDDAVAEANLYLSDFEVPQIRLFNLLGQHVPLVRASSALANALIAQAAAGPRVQLVDVGIGTGRQMVGALEQLAACDQPPEHVLVIGIEPSGWSLKLAERTVLAAAERLGLRCAFYPVEGTAERLSEQQWRQLEALAEAPIINASFALHHILDVHDRDVRGYVLEHLRRLEPAALVLLEPDVHHLEADLKQRFRNCWAHFGQVFRLLDALELPQADRDALKVGFFGREIVDILGNDNGIRTERHESTRSWLQRLDAAGFQTSTPALALPDAAPAQLVDGDAHFSIHFDAVPLISVFYATPSGERLPAPGAPLQSLIRAAAPFDKPSRPPLDARLYLAALREMAGADGRLYPEESAFLDSQARILGVALDTLPDFAALLADQPLPAPALAEAILRDVIFLMHLDDEHLDVEQQRARQIAEALGLSASFAPIEQSVLQVLPRTFPQQPSWFREQWFTSQKTI